MKDIVFTEYSPCVISFGIPFAFPIAIHKIIFHPMRCKNKIIYSFSVWFLLILMFTPYGCSGFKSENEILKEEITDISTENDKLKKELNTLRNENSKMHIRLAQLNLQIASLQNEIQNLQKDIDTFKSQLKGGRKK
jgi:cell division protein FtsB